MPFVDGGIVLCAGIRATPSGIIDLIPEFLRLNRFHGFAGASGFEFPVAIGIQYFEKPVGYPNRVVAVFSAFGGVWFFFVLLDTLHATKMRYRGMLVGGVRGLEGTARGAGRAGRRGMAALNHGGHRCRARG